MIERRTCLVCPDLYDTGASLSSRFARVILERLKRQGEIDVLITSMDRNSINGGLENCKKTNIKYLSELHIPDVRGQDFVTAAYKVYRHVRDIGYHTAHILLPGGSGAYCATAKRQGLIETNIVTYSIDGSEVKRKENNIFPDKDKILIETLERLQSESSDFLFDIDQSSPPNIVPSRKPFCLNQRKQLWPINPYNISNKPIETRHLIEKTVGDLVILGSQSYSSGIDLIIQALRRLPCDIYPDLTFIGEVGDIFGENGAGYIIRHLNDYRGQISFLPHHSDQEAFELLSAPDVLAVIPGRGRDGSWELAQIFSAGAPFFAFGVNGIGEHVDAESLSICNVDLSPDSISSAIIEATTRGMLPIRAAYTSRDIERNWQELLAANCDHPPALIRRPLVSVCLTHYERPTLLQQALEALELQTYDNLEIILVDDGSKSPAALAFLNELEVRNYRFPLKVVRSSNRYLGAARNLAAAHAKGDYLLFHDDDNIAEAKEVEIFVNAALRCGADILTSLYWTFENVGASGPIDRRLLCHAIGTGGPISLLENRFGDANSLIKRAAFHELGGFSQLHGVGYEDWEFFAKAYLRGYNLRVVPEPLFNYRVSSDSMVASINHSAGLERVFRLLDDEQCAFAGDLARMMSRDFAAYHAKTRLSEDLERSKARSQHLYLAELPRNSDKVWALLSEIAIIEGRHDDPAKHVFRSAMPKSAGVSTGAVTVVHAELGPDAALPAVILAGWGVAGNGTSISPTHFYLEGRLYEVCAIVRQPRLDVNERFKISHSVAVGFCIAGRLLRGLKSWRYRLGRGRKIRAPQGKIRLLFRGNDGIVAHIDQCFRAHEVSIQPPSDWVGTLTLETMQPSFPFARHGDDEYRLGLQKSQLRSAFNFAKDQRGSDTISVIAPIDPKADVFFEIDGSGKPV